MSTKRTLLFCLGVLVSSGFVYSAFVSQPRRGFLSKSRRTSLYGIHEWRDIMFDFPGTGDDRRLGTEDGAPPKEVNILPFPYEEVLLQGETKQLRLYEDRFIKLFEDTMENHEGVVAMGLLAESGIIQTVPLCEVEAYNRMEEFGIFVTIRVVGRASLLEVTQQEPYLKAVCTEVVDEIPPNLDLPNLVASNIENFMLLLSSMEHQLAQATEKEDKELDDDEQAMERRIRIAKLDDRFFESPDEEDGDDEDDVDADDDDEDDVDLDRRGRFRKAYEVAMATDAQGYCIPKQENLERTPQELNAISWSAFCTDLLPQEGATYRIQALDSNNLFERLKLASWMLREKKDELRKNLEIVGIRDFSDDSDSDGKDAEF